MTWVKDLTTFILFLLCETNQSLCSLRFAHSSVKQKFYSYILIYLQLLDHTGCCLGVAPCGSGVPFNVVVQTQKYCMQSMCSSSLRHVPDFWLFIFKTKTLKLEYSTVDMAHAYHVLNLDLITSITCPWVFLRVVLEACELCRCGPKGCQHCCNGLGISGISEPEQHHIFASFHWTSCLVNWELLVGTTWDPSLHQNK